MMTQLTMPHLTNGNPLTTAAFQRYVLMMLLIILTGCSRPSEKNYIPKADAARDALETALETWKSGDPHETIIDNNGSIDMVDARWQAGKKLLSYEILREEKSEGPKVFAVKMQITGDKEESEVRYFVLGKDPLWIFREQDYTKATGMGS